MSAARLFLSLALLVALPFAGAEPANRTVEKNPALKPLSAEESMRRINLPPGFRLELVIAEPEIREPVAVAWDGNGRMYVVEMRGYMQDIAGTGARDPVGRISWHEDSDGDGRMDKHGVYLDNLVEPRAILTVDDGLLVGEPSDLWFCRDTDGDGKAESKERVFDQFSLRRSNVEHKANSLTWGIDNWIHVSQHGHRYQFIERTFRNDRVPVVGQWGLTRDDEGRFLFTTNGHPAIGLFIPQGYHQDDPSRMLRRGPMAKAAKWMDAYHSVWPIMVTPDLQSGPGMARSGDGTLKQFTSACGQAFFRGDRLGAGINGDYFLCEPVGRLIRRSKVHYADSGHFELSNRYEKDLGEFISSTDGNFRPVNLHTGPDGCLYIVDMYHGIIQEKAYITDYLRKEILQAEYEKNIRRGRIYRVVRDGIKPGPRPKLLDATPGALIAALAHPNGWWRDTAQSLLVTRQKKSVSAALRAMAAKHESALGRLHALWTLDGLSEMDDATSLAALKDPDLRVRLAAIRTMEKSLAKKPLPAHFSALRALLADPSPHVTAQLILTASQADTRESRDLVVRCIQKHPLNEKVLNAVAAAAPRTRLVDYLEVVLAHPAFQESPLSEEATTQFSYWLQYCIGGIAIGADPKSIDRLLGMISTAESARAQAMLDSISRAIQTNKNKPPRAKLIPFPAKPENLINLEKRPEKEIQDRVKSLAFMFTWPGLPTYGRESAGQAEPLTKVEQALWTKGKHIYEELCMTCHARDGRGLKAPEGEKFLAPPLPGSPRLEQNREASIQILLHGMMGELDGKTYEGGIMAPFGADNDDEWVAAVLTYVRREWGNSGATVTAEDVAAVREKYKDRKTPWKQEELKWGKRLR